jgi:hypothetical protein
MKRVARWIEKQNSRVDGGAVVLHAQTVFGPTKWRVSVEMVTDHRPFNIANGYNLREVLRDAERFLDERSDEKGTFQVAPYLEGEEYAWWCDPLKIRHLG